MNIERLLQSIKDGEGFREEVYKDSLGIDTVGYGFTIKDLQLSEGISSVILRILVLNLIVDVQDRFRWFYLMPNEVQMVVVEMCYQMGISGFSQFKKTIAHLKSFNWVEAADEMLNSKWAKQTPNRAKKLSEKVRYANG